MNDNLEIFENADLIENNSYVCKNKVLSNLREFF